MIIWQYGDSSLIGYFHPAWCFAPHPALCRYNRYDTLRSGTKHRRAFGTIRSVKPIATYKFQVHHIVASGDGERSACEGIKVTQPFTWLLIIGVLGRHRI